MELPAPDTMRAAAAVAVAEELAEGADQPVAEEGVIHVCSSCRGCSAYVYCEVCCDAFCSVCWGAVHKGPLAAHARYCVAQPAGVAPDAPVKLGHGGGVAGMLPPPESTPGMALVAAAADAAAEVAAAASSTARRENNSAALTERALFAAFDGFGAAERSVTIGDVGEYIRRRMRRGNLAASLQRKVTMPPRLDTAAAVSALVSPEAIVAAGGVAGIKEAAGRGDPWSAGVSVAGAGIVGWAYARGEMRQSLTARGGAGRG